MPRDSMPDRRVVPATKALANLVQTELRLPTRPLDLPQGPHCSLPGDHEIRVQARAYQLLWRDAVSPRSLGKHNAAGSHPREGVQNAAP